MQVSASVSVTKFRRDRGKLLLFPFGSHPIVSDLYRLWNRSCARFLLKNRRVLNFMSETLVKPSICMCYYHFIFLYFMSKMMLSVKQPTVHIFLRSSDDGKGIWYRAIVEELKGTQVLVSFIGYGSSHWLDVSKVFRRVEDGSESDSDTSHPTVNAVRFVITQSRISTLKPFFYLVLLLLWWRMPRALVNGKPTLLVSACRS